MYRLNKLRDKMMEGRYCSLLYWMLWPRQGAQPSWEGCTPMECLLTLLPQSFVWDDMPCISLTSQCHMWLSQCPVFLILTWLSGVCHLPYLPPTSFPEPQLFLIFCVFLADSLLHHLNFYFKLLILVPGTVVFNIFPTFSFASSLTLSCPPRHFFFYPSSILVCFQWLTWNIPPSTA